MITALLVLAAVVVVLALVGVVCQMADCGAMWVFHLCCGTPTFLFTLLGQIVAEIVKQNE